MSTTQESLGKDCREMALSLIGKEIQELEHLLLRLSNRFRELRVSNLIEDLDAIKQMRDEFKEKSKLIFHLNMATSSIDEQLDRQVIFLQRAKSKPRR